VDSAGFDAEGLAKGVVDLAEYGLQLEDLTELKRLFEHATTFGSLIQVPEGLVAKLQALGELSKAISQVMFVSEAIKRLGLLVQQGKMLARQYDAVVANPPYMGNNGMNPIVKRFAKDHFPDAKSDLFAVSTERFLLLTKTSGSIGLMTPFTWMFLKSYEALRDQVLENKNLQSLIQPQYHTMFESAAVPVCTFIIENHRVPNYKASFIKLTDFYGADRQPQKVLEAISNLDCGWLYRAKPDEFKRVPGKPLVYWLSKTLLEMFSNLPLLGTQFKPMVGLQTGDNDTFLRLWFEVPISNCGFGMRSHKESKESGKKWFPFTKGGQFRRWYGNAEFLVNWEDDGRELYALRPKSVIRNPSIYFIEGVTWGDITSSRPSFRYLPGGFVIGNRGPGIFRKKMGQALIGHLNSKVTEKILNVLNPTLSLNVGDVGNTPFDDTREDLSCSSIVDSAVAIVRDDWDGYERSWDFQSLPLLTASSDPNPTLESSYAAWIAQNRDIIAEMKRLEEENNRLFIDAYGLQDELTPDVPIEQITLTVNPAYRYGGKLTEEEQWTRFRQDTMKELVSYAIGCMMGRYSLDAPGLIYAHSGGEGFDPGRYTTFQADADGVVPITDTEWFDDDAAHRLIEFISVAWDATHLEANLTFLADNLLPKKNESSRETLRRYLCDSFFKDHLQTYKKRPIYWLFSSGKQKAFQCLVYLHRYNEGTLARMRTEYVIPLQGKMAARIEQLSGDINAATSTAHNKKLERERDKLVKQQAELQAFDEKLRHYADQRISLDLDDGVKVNYGKFGDLLAEVKAVTGKK